MGWLDYHLHMLRAGDEEYGPPSINEDRIGEPVKSERPGINRLLSQEKQEIVYEYDFGDGWEVSVTLEKVLPFDESLTPPVCIDGERNGPLEDSGGPLGYQDKLRLLANPSLPDPDGIREWIPPEFDPEFFDKDAINAQIDEEFL